MRRSEESAKAAAAERTLPGRGVIVNTRSSVDPFLTFSSRRDLRERVWKKFKSRGDNGDQNDTKATIARIVTLRAERARLLGFASHAHWRMPDTMAKDPKAAQALMMRVWPAAVARVREEVADMQVIAAREQGPPTVEPWDYLYYAEKVRKERYDLDESEVKPYLALNQMVAAALWAAVVLAAASGIVRAADVVVATAAWARGTPPGLSMGAAYVTLVGGPTPDRLLAAQLDGVARIEFHESLMDVGIVAKSVLYMADLPLEANVLFHTVMATKMPFVGRG